MKEEKMKNKAKEYIQWQGWQPLGKKLKAKIKKILLQQYLVKGEYNAKKNHKKEERNYKLMCQNERYESIKCEKKHKAM